MTAVTQPHQGLLIVDKPGRTSHDASLPADSVPEASATDERLYTSHDVVQRVRRWSGQRRIGHTGTLDPMASGVLVLCLGQATRLVEYYQGHAKQYYAEVVLGAATDTYDALGQITQTLPVPTFNRAKIEDALQQFRGSMLQSPPVYSAIKQGGESVHRKARRGEEVVLAPRPVTIMHVELVAMPTPDRLCLRIKCSAGTYVRSLAHDLGQALGTAAHLAALRREAAGFFTLAHAHTIAAIESAAQAGRLGELLLPSGFGLAFPRLMLPASTLQRLSHGQQVALDDVAISEFAASETGVVDDASATHLAQVYDERNHFAGIIRCLGKTNNGGSLWKAEKWFAQNTDSTQ